MSSLTKTRKDRTFRSGPYLARLMAELDRAAISTRLGESREQAGLTQPEIADVLHVHWRTVQNWESPRDSAVPWDRLDEWAQITGRPKEWLLHGDPPESKPDLSEINAKLDQLLEERVAIPSPFWETAIEVLERDPAQASASVPELEAAAAMLERASEATLALASRFREAARTAQRSA
jgi:transcriptional regulator with XRE-family HTH domain